MLVVTQEAKFDHEIVCVYLLLTAGYLTLAISQQATADMAVFPPMFVFGSASSWTHHSPELSANPSSFPTSHFPVKSQQIVTNWKILLLAVQTWETREKVNPLFNLKSLKSTLSSLPAGKQLQIKIESSYLFLQRPQFSSLFQNLPSLRSSSCLELRQELFSQDISTGGI